MSNIYTDRHTIDSQKDRHTDYSTHCHTERPANWPANRKKDGSKERQLSRCVDG